MEIPLNDLGIIFGLILKAIQCFATESEYNKFATTGAHLLESKFLICTIG